MHWLIKKIISYSNRVALVKNNTAVTYAELLQRITWYSDFLEERGINSGSTVALLSDYGLDSIALLLALLDRKNIIVPILSTVEDEINTRLTEGGVSWVFKWSPDLQLVSYDNLETHPLVVKLVEGNRAGLILFSSGTTGKPKAMIHDLDSFVLAYRDRRPKDLVLLALLLFDHVGGLNTLFNSLAMGGTLVIPENNTPQIVCELIGQWNISILPGSPTFLNLLLISGVLEQHNLQSLRMITYGTEPMPESLLKRLKSAFPRVKFLQTFGTSETGIMQTTSKSSDSLFMKLDGSNTEYKIVNGELWLRSQTQIMGYLNADTDAFTEDGWFKTGDLVEESSDGYIRIVGRDQDIINVGGEKVFPSEVESILLMMPEIIDCVIFGETNAITGQTVVAEVVTRDQTNPRELRGRIRQFCSQKLTKFKVPTKIYLVDEIVTSNRGKKKRTKKQ
jgi:acyl-coenzyme A synthetase/AMP-(fatty) acid ligase